MVRSAVAPAAKTSVTTPVGGAGRPRWWAEILLIAVCYVAYSFVRNLVPSDHAGSVQRAYQLLEAQRALHLDIELAVNRFFVDVHWLGVAANYYYATLHFGVTAGVLLWLYVRHPSRYVTYRWLLFSTTVTALIGFWFFPLAPPRMLPGYVDTVIAFNTWGLYDSSPVATVSNQYAAMPSLHTAWSLWCCLAVLAIVRRTWVKVLAVAYPVVTVVVILGTANHFILDAVAGAGLLVACQATGIAGLVVYRRRAAAPAAAG
ncbi:PAP2 family protein [Actinomadura craniellae]|uniref:PAP2 family protein n=1 Tax=Actinomadura craniellae TaxID=2231787 RepID=A0A365H238_9ACTN|nr:phosphatase PAP2 family protein [Actinomadura craniellae]RAY13157.1 PAP2 family protein [Actinomadura craniellae]